MRVDSTTWGRCSTSSSLTLANTSPPLPRDFGKCGTATSQALLHCKNLGYAVSVRRAPDAIAITAPPKMPSISVSDSHALHRALSSARARNSAAVMYDSFRPQDPGGLQPGGDPAGNDGQEVGHQNGHRDGDQDRDDRDRRGGDDPEPLGEHVPSPPAADDPERNPHHQRCHRERAGLPCDRGRDLASDKPERLQDGEVE